MSGLLSNQDNQKRNVIDCLIDGMMRKEEKMFSVEGEGGVYTFDASPWLLSYYVLTYL